MTESIQKITAAASQGLTRAEVVATVLGGREMTDAERTAFDKARGIWKLREAKRKAEKRAAGPMTGAERIAKHRDAAINIDRALDEARARAASTESTERRDAAEKSLAAWIRAYCVGVLINDPPPAPHGEKILTEMDAAVGDSKPYQILVGRGGGKTSYTECCAAYAIATGRRRFVVVTSINAKQAQQILRETTALFTSEPFATDYPDIALPITLLDGHGRRSQRQGGHDTKVRIVTDETLLPTITLPDGTPSRASGACIRAKALKSVRGTKNGTQRPDLIVLDDLQTTEIATNAERVADVLRLIRSDVMGLAGKDKAAIISTATTIAADDITEQLDADPVWKTTKYPSVIKWPREWRKENHGLWGEYFAMFDAENAEDRSHKRKGGSLDFYRRNRKAMDAGADVLNWDAFDRNGQISGLQRLVDTYHQMGHAAFMAEHQMEPVREAFAFELAPGMIVSRVRPGTPRGALLPEDERVFVCAATDINPSYALSTVVCSFDRDRTCLVGAYARYRVSIPQDLNDTEYNRRVFDALAAHGREVASLGVKLDAWGIDAGGHQFDAVLSFAKNGPQACGLAPTPMIGRAGRSWNPNVRSKIRAAINDTVTCRDQRRVNWIAWNADTWRESAQKAWGTETGAPGGCSLFDGDASHVDFATQVANEPLKAKVAIPGGGFRYVWKPKDPHDFGDCMAMCYALAGANGINGDGNFTPRARKAKFFSFK